MKNIQKPFLFFSQFAKRLSKLDLCVKMSLEKIMSFCKYSTEFIASSKTEIDNIFINDYLPFAQPAFSQVYIYGLYLCSSNSFDNSLENMAKTLNMSEDDVLGAFEYWQEQGLVNIVKASPLQISYIPLKNVLSANKLYKPDKYEAFNRQAEDIFKGKRSISKTEYGEYYDFLERYHVEQEALLMIMQYCVDTKKSAVGYNYILTVARNWANEGITTTSAVEERLKTFEENSADLALVLKTAGIKRGAYVEERNLLHKWLEDYGFTLDTILYVIKAYQKKNRFSFERIDAVLTKYYEMKLMSVSEIEAFENEKTELYSLAKEINKAIGVYYENLEVVVENYILKWINLGFDNQTLLDIANLCFKTSVRTLEGMDERVNKCYKLGLLSQNAFNEYMGQVIAEDNEIKSVLANLNISRGVTPFDRANFKTWKNDWRMPEELILHATILSKGKDNALKYMARILADWHEKGIKTVEEAKKSTPLAVIEQKSQIHSNFTGRSYTKGELNALTQSIDEIEI